MNELSILKRFQGMQEELDGLKRDMRLIFWLLMADCAVMALLMYMD